MIYHDMEIDRLADMAEARPLATPLPAERRAHDLANVITGLVGALELGREQLVDLRDELVASGCEADPDLEEAISFADEALAAAGKVTSR